MKRCSCTRIVSFAERIWGSRWRLMPLRKVSSMRYAVRAAPAPARARLTTGGGGQVAAECVDSRDEVCSAPAPC